MENFEENNLKPEEVSSGFKYGEQDGDSFGGKKALNNTVNPPSGTVPPSYNTQYNSGDVNSSIPRKSNLWKWILSIALIALFILVEGYLILDKLIDFPKGEKPVGSNTVSLENEEENSPADADVITDPSIIKDIDLNTDSLINAISSKPDAQNYSEDIEKNIGDEHHEIKITKTGNTLTIERTVESIDGDKPQRKFVQNYMIDGKPKIASNDKITSQKVNKNTNPKENIKVEKEIVIKEGNKKQEMKNNTFTFEKKKDETKTAPSIASNTATKTSPVQQDRPTPPQVDDKGPVYTIQVYSSPSNEDAQYWVSRLKNMGIASAYVSTQKIRDITWYRVRFGNYPNKEEAQSAASKFGFNQLWIDRIK